MEHAPGILHALTEMGITDWKAVVTLMFAMVCFAWSFHQWLNYKANLNAKE